VRLSIKNREVERKKSDLASYLAQDDYFVDCSVRFYRQTKNSLLFKIRHNHNRKEYMVKFPARRSSAELEYDSLKKIQGIFTDPCLRSPKTYFYLPSLDGYCMEYVDGHDVKKTLHGRYTSHQRKESTISLCGRWLKEFHNTFKEKEIKIDFSKQLQEFSQRLSIDNSNGNILLAQLIDLYPTVEDRYVNWGHTHGDCKTDNMIHKSGSVYGIDFVFRTKGYQIMDVVQFINNMFLLRQESFLSKNNRKYENTFLSSYFFESEQSGKEELEWLRLYHLFTQWDGYVRNGDFRSMRKAKMLHKYLNHELSLNRK